MRNVSQDLRLAYIQALSSLKLNGVAIPVVDEYLNVSEAQLNITPTLKAKAHVKITNQTDNDASLKCAINQNHTLQLDCTVTFPANSGGYLQSELIANNCLDLLFDGMKTTLQSDNLNIWRAWLEGSRNISEETQTSRIFRRVLIFNHSLQQKEITT